MPLTRSCHSFRLSVLLGTCAAALLLNPAGAFALEKCKAVLSSKDGSITVGAGGVTGTLLWGPEAGSETNAFFNAATCVTSGKASKCVLGDVGTPERITPPPLCTIYLKDDAGTDSCFIKGCVPGAREDLSGDVGDLAIQVEDLTTQVADLSARVDALEVAVDGLAQMHPTLGKQIIFVTSGTFTGNIGGLAGADAACAMHALIGGLSGTYLAWLSDGVTAPADRMTQSSTPYYLTDGVTIVANDWADLTDGNLAHAIDRDEAGRIYGGNSDAWTNVTTAGNVSDPVNTCAGFTSGSVGLTGKTGRIQRADYWWTDIPGGPSCNGGRAIYCVRQ